MEMTGAREMRLKMLRRARRLIDMNAKTSMDPGMFSFKKRETLSRQPSVSDVARKFAHVEATTAEMALDL